jgi:hypothetical protein
LTLTKAQIENGLLRSIVSDQPRAIYTYLHSIRHYHGLPYPTLHNGVATPSATTNTTANNTAATSPLTTPTSLTPRQTPSQTRSQSGSTSGEEELKEGTRSTNGKGDGDDGEDERTLQFNSLLNKPLPIPFDLRQFLPTTFIQPVLDIVSPRDENEGGNGGLDSNGLMSSATTSTKPLLLTPIAFLILTYIPKLPHSLPLDSHLGRAIPHLVDGAMGKALELIQAGARIDSTTFLLHSQSIQSAIFSTLHLTTLYLQQQSVMMSTADVMHSSSTNNPFGYPAPLSLPSLNTDSSKIPTSGSLHQKLISFMGLRIQPTLEQCAWLLFMCSELLQVSVSAHYEHIIHGLYRHIDNLTYELLQYQPTGSSTTVPSSSSAFLSKYSTHDPLSPSTHPRNMGMDRHHEDGTYAGMELSKFTFSHGAKPFLPSGLQPPSHHHHQQQNNNNNNNNNNNQHNNQQNRDPHELLPAKPKAILPVTAFPSLGTSKKDRKDDQTQQQQQHQQQQQQQQQQLLLLQQQQQQQQALLSNGGCQLKGITTTSTGKQLTTKEEKLLEKALRAKEKKSEAKAAKKLKVAEQKAQLVLSGLSLDPASPTTAPSPAQDTGVKTVKKEQPKVKKVQVFNIDEFHRITSSPGDNTPLATSIKPQNPYGSPSGFNGNSGAVGRGVGSGGQNFLSVALGQSAQNQNLQQQQQLSSRANGTERPALRTTAQPFVPSLTPPPPSNNNNNNNNGNPTTQYSSSTLQPPPGLLPPLSNSLGSANQMYYPGDYDGDDDEDDEDGYDDDDGDGYNGYLDDYDDEDHDEDDGDYDDDYDPSHQPPGMGHPMGPMGQMMPGPHSHHLGHMAQIHGGPGMGPNMYYDGGMMGPPPGGYPSHMMNQMNQPPPQGYYIPPPSGQMRSGPPSGYTSSLFIPPK